MFCCSSFYGHVDAQQLYCSLFLLSVVWLNLGKCNQRFWRCCDKLDWLCVYLSGWRRGPFSVAGRFDPSKGGLKMGLRRNKVRIVILMLIFFSSFVHGVVGAVGPQLPASVTYTAIMPVWLVYVRVVLRVITLRSRARPVAEPSFL